MRSFFCHAVFFALFGFALLGCQQQAVKPTQLSGPTMGTSWSVSYLPGEHPVDPTGLKVLIQQRLERINRLMSTYDPESEISRFNDQTGDAWFSISKETAEVIALSQKISQLTHGAFDISVGPLVELWGFGASERAGPLPSDAQLRQQLARVGYQKLELRDDPPAIRKTNPKLRIDLSAVAKGYAVDVLKELLEEQGLHDFIVEIGGELQLSGRRHDGRPWQIAIEKPREGVREVASILPLSQTALATSGNYRNYYTENGQRYVHTIDPVSGRPIQHKLASVTVLDPRCARADALATALMVMGEVQGRQFVEENHIAAYFLIHDKEALVDYASPVFQTILKAGDP